MPTLFVKVNKNLWTWYHKKNMSKSVFKNLINLKKKAQGFIHFRDYKVLFKKNDTHAMRKHKVAGSDIGVTFSSTLWTLLPFHFYL